MKKEFIPYEEALALKELGFDEKCLKCYWYDGMIDNGFNLINWNSQDGCFNAPLYQQAFRWFRDEYDLYADIHRIGIKYNAEIECMGLGNSLVTVCEQVLYEEAELSCLRQLIEIVKK